MSVDIAPHNRKPPGERPASIRSRVTNGKRSFVDGDGTSAWARRHRDLCELHIEDLGHRETLSEGQLSLCRRAATLEVQLEAMEGALSKGEEVDLDVYARVAGHLRRILESLGIERRARDITPTLEELIADAARKDAAS